MVRPDPIPNSAVKHWLADGSACIACARVGSRQPLIKPELMLRLYFFCTSSSAAEGTSCTIVLPIRSLSPKLSCRFSLMESPFTFTPRRLPRSSTQYKPDSCQMHACRRDTFLSGRMSKSGLPTVELGLPTITLRRGTSTVRSSPLCMQWKITRRLNPLRDVPSPLN